MFPVQHGEAVMSEEDQRYYSRRAEEELVRAESSTHERAMIAHYHLAGYYLDRIYGGGDSLASPENR